MPRLFALSAARVATAPIPIAAVSAAPIPFEPLEVELVLDVELVLEVELVLPLLVPPALVPPVLVLPVLVLPVLVLPLEPPFDKDAASLPNLAETLPAKA